MSKSVKKIIAETDASIAKLDELKKDLPECEVSLNLLQQRFIDRRVAAADRIGRKKKP